jgi:hypothetical protein
VSRHTIRWSFLFGVVLVLAACGGSGGTPATTTAEPTTAATDDSGGGSTGGGGGGAFAGKACDLLTAGEVEAATQQTGITASEVPATDTEGSAACGYLVQATAPVVVLTVLDSQNTSVDLGSYTSLPGAVTVDVGSGAQAVYVPSINAMFVFKNGLATTLQVIAPAPGEEVIQTATKLAKSVAGRLP